MSNRYGLELRAATVGDAPGIAELLSAADQPSAINELADRLDALQHTPGVALLASEWGPPSGLVVAHWHQTLAASRPIAFISTLVVSPDARRRGIGRVLLKSASQAARLAGCETLSLHTRADNHELRAFCLSTGFAEEAVGFVRPLRKRTDR